MDDGASSFEESLAMLKMAAANGTTDIVATPHANSRFQLQPEEIAKQIARLSVEAQIPKIHWGCDFHLSFDNIEAFFETPYRYTVNSLRYLLVEFSDFEISAALSDVFLRMLGNGFTPILTHPERNQILSKNLKLVAAFVDSGCLVQLTAQSFLGRFGKTAESAARQMLSKKLVHIIASDAHDLEHRPPNLRPAYNLIVNEFGAGLADTLFVQNPRAVLTGADLPEPQNVTPTRRWFKL